MARRWLPVFAGLVWLTGCGTEQVEAREEPELVEQQPTSSTSMPATTVQPPAVVAETTVPAPTFESAIRAVEVEELGESWRAGCPVAVEELRWLDLSHWDGEGRTATGSMVLHADHADAIVGVFGQLFDAGFPIHSMRPITDFGGDDNASMRANNTSAFNCREIDGRPGVWSQHAYGGAIDINPLVNPWVRGSRVDPPEGTPYVDRASEVPGLIVAGDVVTQAFADIGWGWGGDWTSTLDFQHFSHNGK